MFRVRSKRFMQAAVAIPVTALLLTGCGDDEAEPAAADTATSPAAAATTAEATEPSTEISATAQSMEEMQEDMLVQLEVAAKEAGPKQLGALTCETMRGFAMTAGEAPDEAAVAEALGLLLTSIVKGVNEGESKVEAADLDSTTEKECSEQRQEVLELAGVKSLESVVTT